LCWARKFRTQKKGEKRTWKPGGKKDQGRVVFSKRPGKRRKRVGKSRKSGKKKVNTHESFFFDSKMSPKGGGGLKNRQKEQKTLTEGEWGGASSNSVAKGGKKGTRKNLRRGEKTRTSRERENKQRSHALAG